MSKIDIFRNPDKYFFVRNKKHEQIIIPIVYNPSIQNIIREAIKSKKTNLEIEYNKKNNKIFFIKDENDTLAITKDYPLVAYPNNIGDIVLLALEKKYNHEYPITDLDITTPYDIYSSDSIEAQDAFKNIQNDDIKKEIIRRLVRDHKQLVLEKVSNEATFSHLGFDMLYERINIITRMYDNEVVPNINVYRNKLGTEAMFNGMLSFEDTKKKIDFIRLGLLRE